MQFVPSADNKFIYKHLAALMGGKPKVTEFLHNTLPLRVDIFSVLDVPSKGECTYSTIGLSDHPMLDDDGEEFPARLEMLLIGKPDNKRMLNVLGSAAFCVIQTRQLYSPGSVLTGYVHEYYPATTVPNLYLTAPYVWPKKLGKLRCKLKTVAWLHAVPITNAEAEFLQENGDEALEKKLEKAAADVTDLKRTSVC